MLKKQQKQMEQTREIIVQQLQHFLQANKIIF